MGLLGCQVTPNAGEVSLSFEPWAERKGADCSLLKYNCGESWTPRNIYYLLSWGCLHHTVVLTVAASQPLIGPREMLILSCPGKEGSCSPQVRISLCNPLILLFFCFFLSSTYKYFLAFLKNQALALLNFYQPNLFHKKKKWSKKNKRWRN